MNNDLISRAALLERFEKAQSNVGTLVETVFFDGVMVMVDTAPAVDAEPVRRGRWELETSKYLRRCSACEKVTFYRGAGRHYDYCPNCGAKMDGDENAAD